MKPSILLTAVTMFVAAQAPAQQPAAKVECTYVEPKREVVDLGRVVGSMQKTSKFELHANSLTISLCSLDQCRFEEVMINDFKPGIDLKPRILQLLEWRRADNVDIYVIARTVSETEDKIQLLLGGIRNKISAITREYTAVNTADMDFGSTICRRL